MYHALDAALVVHESGNHVAPLVEGRQPQQLHAVLEQDNAGESQRLPLVRLHLDNDNDSGSSSSSDNNNSNKNNNNNSNNNNNNNNNNNSSSSHDNNQAPRHQHRHRSQNSSSSNCSYSDDNNNPRVKYPKAEAHTDRRCPDVRRFVNGGAVWCHEVSTFWQPPPLTNDTTSLLSFAKQISKHTPCARRRCSCAGRRAGRT
jgi:hypothetical protein